MELFPEPCEGGPNIGNLEGGAPRIELVGGWKEEIIPYYHINSNPCHPYLKSTIVLYLHCCCAGGPWVQMTEHWD